MKRSIIPFINNFPDVTSRSVPSDFSKSQVMGLANAIKATVDESFAIALADKNDLTGAYLRNLPNAKNKEAQAIYFDTVVLKNHPRCVNLTKDQRVVILATIAGESSFYPYLSGGSKPGQFKLSLSSNLVFGLYQFTGYRAYVFLKWFASRYKNNPLVFAHDIYNPFIQITFLMDEIEGKVFNDAWMRQLKKRTSWFENGKYQNLVREFTYHFIAPADKEGDSIKRTAFAKSIFLDM